MSGLHPSICRYFASTGNCYYGDQCNFIHSYRPEHAPPAHIPKSQRPCRNIAIHGYCKFAGKGCEYNHDMQTKEEAAAAVSPVLDPKDEIPPAAIPGTSPGPSPTKRPSDKLHPSYTANQSWLDHMPGYGSLDGEGNGQGAGNSSNGDSHSWPPHYTILSNPEAQYKNSTTTPTAKFYAPSFTPSFAAKAAVKKEDPATGGKPAISTTMGGTTYFYNPNSGAPPPPSPQQIARRNMQTFFMSENIRQDLQKRVALTLATAESEKPGKYKDLPQLVANKYHSLLPLDDAQPKPLGVAQLAPERASKFMGYHTTVYRAISSADGNAYVLRALEGVRVSSDYSLAVVDVWKQVQHPNIVTLKEAFPCKDFNEFALVFVYDYHPGAETLESRYINQHNNYIAENVLWSYISQIASALRAVHKQGLAFRLLDPSKIILTGKNRIRLNCAGILDVINFDAGKNMTHLQHEDLLSLGKLILSLTCKSMTAPQNLPKSMEYVASHYSADVKNLVIFLLAKPTANFTTIDDVCSMITGRLMLEIEHLHNYTDMLESELAKELENGRLFRLMVKLGFINERPEFDMDPSWSETGDRYLLKLFRDYVFHQVYDDGSPVVDYAHVVSCLNKLDVGIPEKVLLTSRDEQSMLVVSYKDLKRCIEGAFNDLLQKQYNQPGSYSGAVFTPSAQQR